MLNIITLILNIMKIKSCYISKVYGLQWAYAPYVPNITYLLAISALNKDHA